MLRTVEERIEFHALTQEIFFLRFDDEIPEIDVLEAMQVNLIRFGNQIITDFENWIDTDQQRMEELVFNNAIYFFFLYLESIEFENEESSNRARELAQEIHRDILSRWQRIVHR